MISGQKKKCCTTCTYFPMFYLYKNTEKYPLVSQKSSALLTSCLTQCLCYKFQAMLSAYPRLFPVAFWNLSPSPHLQNIKGGVFSLAVKNWAGQTIIIKMQGVVLSLAVSPAYFSLLDYRTTPPHFHNKRRGVL